MEHKETIIIQGNIEQPQKALILLHGRGGNASDILSLSQHLHVADYLLLAPQATNSTWYPHSFLAAIQDNQPWLDSALNLVDRTVERALEHGVTKDNIYFLGFSQGACLTLEYVARNASKYGGAIAFTGGLIGEQIHLPHYKGSFDNMPIYIGSSDPDIHVPVERVQESSKVLSEMKADVTERIYPNMGHTITKEEIDLANQIIFR